MKVKIYKQAFDYTLDFNNPIEIEVTKKEIKRGFTTMDCPCCQGSGISVAPESNTDCNTCKGTGERYVNL